MRKLTLAVLVGAVGAAGACNAPQAPGGVLLQGMWGSDQGRLTATQSSVTWSGACGSGTAEPIMLDKHGKFEIAGTYRAAGSATTRNVQYQGEPSKGRLTLLVRMSDTEKVGPIMLNLNDNTPTGVCR